TSPTSTAGAWPPKGRPWPVRRWGARKRVTTQLRVGLTASASATAPVVREGQTLSRASTGLVYWSHRRDGDGAVSATRAPSFGRRLGEDAGAPVPAGLSPSPARSWAIGRPGCSRHSRAVGGPTASPPLYNRKRRCIYSKLAAGHVHVNTPLRFLANLDSAQLADVGGRVRSSDRLAVPGAAHPQMATPKHLLRLHSAQDQHANTEAGAQMMGTENR